MAFKDILVHLDSGSRSATRLGIAAGLARRFGAQLTGVYVVDIPSAEFFYGAAMPLAAGGAEQVVDQIRTEAVAAAEPVEASFRELLRREGLDGGWRLVEGNLPATVALHARYADLAVLGQANPYDHLDAQGHGAVLAATVMGSGRPGLAVPFVGDFPTLGQRVLVAWNASREAARAVNDALPLLREAAAVTVLAVNPRRGVGGHGDVPAADIALHRRGTACARRRRIPWRPTFRTARRAVLCGGYRRRPDRFGAPMAIRGHANWCSVASRAPCWPR